MKITHKLYLGIAFSTLFLLLFASGTIAQSVKTAALNLEDYSRTDSRILNPTTIDATGITLGELLKKITVGSLVLKADSEYTDMRLKLHFTNRPLWICMNALADMLPGKWSELKNGQGYLLQMTEEARKKRDNWWRLYENECRESLQIIRNAALKEMQKRPVKMSQNEFAGLPANVAALLNMSRSNQFFYNLEPQQQEQIADQISTIDPTQYVGDNIASPHFILPYANLSPLSQQEVQKALPDHDKSRFSSGFLLITLERFSATVQLLLKDEGAFAVPTGLQYSTIQGDLVLPLDHKGLFLIPEIALNSKYFSDNIKKLRRYQDEKVWINDPPPKTLPMPLSRTHFPDALARIAEKSNIDYLADYYSRDQEMPMSNSEKSKPLGHSLKNELDYLAELNDVSWKKNIHEIYLFRNNRWYRDDALQVPGKPMSDFLAGWKLEKKKQEEKGYFLENPLLAETKEARLLRWGTDIISKLTVRQIAYGLRFYVDETLGKQFKPELYAALEQDKSSYSQTTSSPSDPIWQPFFGISQFALNHLELLRFNAGLDDGQKNLLLSGQLKWSALNARQRHLSFPLLFEYYADFETSDPDNIILSLGMSKSRGMINMGSYAQGSNYVPTLITLVAKSAASTK